MLLLCATTAVVLAARHANCPPPGRCTVGSRTLLLSACCWCCCHACRAPEIVPLLLPLNLQPPVVPDSCQRNQTSCSRFCAVILCWAPGGTCMCLNPLDPRVTLAPVPALFQIFPRQSCKACGPRSLYICLPARMQLCLPAAAAAATTPLSGDLQDQHMRGTGEGVCMCIQRIDMSPAPVAGVG